MVTYNPDGKQIVARENDFSKLRSEDMSQAYFNCHTDITIPYDELDKITVIRKMVRQKILFPMDVLCSQESKN